MHSCGGSDGGSSITQGKYHGQFVLGKADISKVPNKKLTVKPLAEREGMEGIIDTDKKLKTLTQWYEEAVEEVKNTIDVMDRVALQSDMICQMANFVDVDYISALGMTNAKVDSIYKAKGVPVRDRKNITSHPLKFLQGTLDYDFGTNKWWEDATNRQQVYLHAKHHSDSFRDYMNVYETDFLRTLKGKADTQYEATRFGSYMNNGLLAIKDLPLEERRGEYLNLLCQHFKARDNSLEDGTLVLSMRAKAMAVAMSNGDVSDVPEDVLKAVKAFEDAETAQEVTEENEKVFFSKDNFKILGLPYESMQDERMLRKELASKCPAYLEFVKARQGSIPLAIKIINKTGFGN